MTMVLAGLAEVTLKGRLCYGSRDDGSRWRHAREESGCSLLASRQGRLGLKLGSTNYKDRQTIKIMLKDLSRVIL
jgi:hypothetical protein